MKEKIKEKKERKNEGVLSLLVDEGSRVDFQPDYEDPRFQKLYGDPEYGIDPTHNSFGRDRYGNELMLQSQIKRLN